MSKTKSQTPISNLESFDKFWIFVWKLILYPLSLSLFIAPIIMLFDESSWQDEGKGTQIIIIIGSFILSLLFFLAAKYYFTLSGVKKRRLTSSPEYQQKMLDESIKREELRRSKFPHKPQANSLPFLSTMLGFLSLIIGLLLMLPLLYLVLKCIIFWSLSYLLLILLILPISILTIVWGGLTAYANSLQEKRLSDAEYKFFLYMKNILDFLDGLIIIIFFIFLMIGGVFLTWKIGSLIFYATGSIVVTVLILMLLFG